MLWWPIPTTSPVVAKGAGDRGRAARWIDSRYAVKQELMSRTSSKFGPAGSRQKRRVIAIRERFLTRVQRWNSHVPLR